MTNPLPQPCPELPPPWTDLTGIWYPLPGGGRGYVLRAAGPPERDHWWVQFALDDHGVVEGGLLRTYLYGLSVGAGRGRATRLKGVPRGSTPRSPKSVPGAGEHAPDRDHDGGE